MIETWSITKILDWTTDYFKKFNIEWPHLEAEILLAYSLGLKRIELYTNHERVLAKEELGKYKTLIERRNKREPIAYITNNQPFMSLDFFVDRSVLIPRPETELLVEKVIELISNLQSPISNFTIADIGTGSGCIAVSLAKYLPEVKVLGIDSSPEAIETAQRNAKAHQIDDRCQFLVGDLFEPLAEKFDIIVSNPPYIPSDQIDKLEEDVKIWEPRHALDGGQDGLDYIRKLIAEAPHWLVSQGRLLIEIGFDQGKTVKELVEKNKNFQNPEIIKDLNQKDRLLKAALL